MLLPSLMAGLTWDILAGSTAAAGTETQAAPSDALALFIAAAIGAILGAVVSAITNRRSAQAKTLFDMHREYFQSLVISRELAARLISKYADVQLNQIWITVDAAEIQHFWHIVYFYERLWTAIRHRYVKPRLVLEVFADSFNWWYVVAYEQKIVPLNDPTSKHIASLYSWMQKHATKDERESMERYLATWQLESAPDHDAPAKPSQAEKPPQAAMAPVPDERPLTETKSVSDGEGGQPVVG